MSIHSHNLRRLQSKGSYIYQIKITKDDIKDVNTNGER